MRTTGEIPAMPKNILVTGGAGFVGTAVAVALKTRLTGVEVVSFDNLRRSGSPLNLPRLRRAGVRFVHGDVRSAEDMLSLRPAPDLIVECSAEASAQAGYAGSPDYLIHTNLAGCFNCLKLAQLAKADFLFLSTSRVYPYRALNRLAFREDETRFRWTGESSLPGFSSRGVAEGFSLDGPRSLYGMTKLAAEYMVEEFADAYGFRFLIDRPGLIAGPWQMAKSDQGVLTLWLISHYFSRRLSYIGFGGTGKQVRDFLHIDDFCDLIADQASNFPAYCGRRFNVGGGVENSVSLLEATRLCREITGKSPAVASSPETRPADLRVYITDSREVSAVRNWRPRRDARALFGDIASWVRAEEKDLAGVI